MWLLSTNRAKLHFFPSPEAVPGGYAILSHVWDAQENTFQDIQARHAEPIKTSKWFSRPLKRRNTVARPVGSKIREGCSLAKRQGWKWIWIDTCCIDKTSNAELSEAVNSMYQYYSLSGACYAFLSDVPILDVSGEESGTSIRTSIFGRSRWHTRGWTLMELLSPRRLIFVSSTWKVLGDRHTLAPILSSITGIAQSFLRLEEDFSTVSIADRMSWAARRDTTRPEDEAYCLMGLFGVNMPTIYGEGARRAFYRLQEEIMKTSADPSLFAWGPSGEFNYNFFRTRSSYDYQYLLAPSPQYFSLTKGSVEFSVSKTEGQLNIAAPHRCPNSPEDHSSSVTPKFIPDPHGVIARLPMISLSAHDGVASRYLALLCCTEVVDGVCHQLGLLLSAPVSIVENIKPRMYHCRGYASRLVHVDWNKQSGEFEWTTLHIAAKPPFSDVAEEASRHPSIHRVLLRTISEIDVPFRVPPECYVVGDFRCYRAVCAARSLDPVHADTRPPMLLRYIHEDADIGADWQDSTFKICLGVCERSAGAHWAHVHGLEPSYYVDDDEDPCDAHVCERDHISANLDDGTLGLPSGEKSWASLCLDLKFTVCPVNETGRTLVMHLSHPKS